MVQKLIAGPNDDLKEVINLKTKLAILGAAAAFALMATPTLAVVYPSAPAQCSGMTFTKTIVDDTPGTTVDATLYTAGRFLIFARGGGVTVTGGSGNDCVVVDGDNNIVDAGAGNDVILNQNTSGAGNGDVLHAGSGLDKVYGSTGIYSLYGDSGNDTLNGSATSYLDGGSGTDICNGGATLVSCNP